MPKRNRNTFSCMDDVPGVPTGTGEEQLVGSMNNVKDIPVDPIVVYAEEPVSDVLADFESECFEDTIPADSDDENINCADGVPDIPICPDDAKGTLPE